MEPEKKYLKIYKEDIKIQHTSHWDWDYLTHAQIDAILKDVQNETPEPPELSTRMRRRRVWGWILIFVGFAVGGIAAGIFFLART